MPTLNWIGKDKVVNHHQEVPYRVLEHKYGFRDGKQSEEETESGNLIIHGDNLLALKALLPKYQGKVNCIYIDVPYNTGNEKWVYNDNVNEPHIKKWLGEIVGTEGEDLSRHDKWLCMMYPRLVLLQKLLSDSGFIFISIDDNEQANLKLICDEVFGNQNFIFQITWRRTDNQPNIGKIAKVAEYILVYAKDGRNCQLGRLPLTEKAKAEYRYSDEKGAFRRGILLDKTRGRFTYPVVTKGGNVLTGPWMVTEEKLKELDRDNLVYWTSGGDEQPYSKIYLDDTKGQIPNNFWGIEFGTNQRASLELESMFGKRVFDFPKPTLLIENIIQLGSRKNGIILDSFAGSGTTAHAVLNLNKRDKANRKFILVEMLDYAEDITAERVRKVIQGYGEGNKSVEGTGGAFDFYELGEPLFLENGYLNEEVGEDKIREYIYFSDTQQPLQERTPDNKYYLGNAYETAYYFYYERNAMTILNHETLRQIVTKSAEQYIIYADICTLTEDEMSRLSVVFKKIPRDIKRF